MTKPELAEKLRKVGTSMIDVAADMAYYGGLNPLYQQHARELLGAADLVGEWADEIEKEGKF